MVAVFASLVCGARGAAACPELARVMATANELVALGPRVDNSAAARETVDRIEAALTAAGLTPTREVIGSVDVPRAGIGSWTIRRAGTYQSTSENIWVRIGGSGPARVLLGHYDTVPGSPGAVDNAIAVGILLEVARCLAAEPPPGPVILAFPGGEERGLLGARALAEKLVAADPAAVEMALSFDLVGHQTHLALNGLSAMWGPDRLRWLRDRVSAADADAAAPIPHRLVSRKLPQLERSDHGAFTERGVPAVHAYGRDDERIFLAYHTPLDTMEQVSEAAVENALRLAHEVATAHAPLPDDSGGGALWLSTPVGAFIVSATVLLPFEIVLVIGAVVLLLLCIERREVGLRLGAIGVFASIGILVAAFAASFAAGVIAERVHGNPMAPAHAPLRFVLGHLIVAAAVFALVVVALSRWWGLARGVRFHATAAGLELAFGGLLMAVGALELAWWPLLIAILFGLAGRLLERPIAATLVTVIGIAVAVVPVLSPGFLREAVFHGFYPPSLPLAGYLALTCMTSALALIGAVRARVEVPDGWLKLVVAGALVLVIGAAGALLVVPEPICSPEASAAHGLACELSGISPKN